MTKNDLPEEFRHDLQIINETTQQIIRDFQNHSLNILFSGNNSLAFDELKEQLIPFVRALMKNTHAFNALLYRIDISEKELRSSISNNASPSEELITELIIRREFKKVLTRRYFKKP